MTGSVVLTKTDEETNEVLQGAVFELQDKDGNVLQSGLTTNEAGQLSVDELVPGDYQLVETQAPTGYELDQTPVTFTVEKGQTEAVQVQMTNKETPGSVILTKTDDKTGEVLQGAVFELQDKDGNVLQSGLITDESGKIAVNDLKSGDYQLVETQAPTGYELDATPVTFTIEKGQTEAVQVQKTNKLTPGSVILTKTDDKTGEVLQGAVFELQDNEGKVLQSNLITDETGKIVINDLAPGEYQLVETQAPTGYELDQTPVDVTIKKGQTEAIQVAKTNKLILGSVILTKIDATNGEVLQGAIFELQDEKGKTLQSNLTTDETGKIALTDLVPGNYQLVEVQAPTGYDLDATPVTFTVNKDSKEVIQLTKANQRTKGSITLQKVDDVSGQLLSGAVFELQDENHHVILKNMKTDESGKLTVEKLTPGTYYFVETQAPDGYQLDKTPLKFIVQGSKEKAQKITKVNKEQENTLRIVKKDNVNQTLLDGAVFTLYDGKGKIIQQNIKTNQAGVAVVGNLKAGEYTLKETKAPAGYQLDESPITITMDKKQNFVTLDVYNTQKKVSKNEEKPSIQPSSRYGKSENTYFPNTGVKNSLYLMIMGILIVILSIIWLVLKFVKGNKKNGI
ncbi:SpaA isopeptide-forming pilin-related protein [Enterococcus faecalis]|nr:SpaA isopeptide-forming pilin-related protein [Enterococcus faecalis]